jgi:hypothetical protein
MDVESNSQFGICQRAKHIGYPRCHHRPMSDPHWEKLKEIFHAAVALAPGDRRAYGRSPCISSHVLLQYGFAQKVKV